MTTATAKRVQEFVPVVMAAYEVPRAPNPKAVIKYAMLHRRGDIYDRIFNEYCPKVPLAKVPYERRQRLFSPIQLTDDGEMKGRAWTDLPEEVDGSPVMVPDPDVLWVGRLMDGLVWLGVFQTRKIAKDYLNSGTGSLDSKTNLRFERAGLPVLDLGVVVKDREPGEIGNSATDVTDVDNGYEETWEPTFSELLFTPKIRVDTRFNLHYLKRGDRLTAAYKGWPKPRQGETEKVWELRPPSEGPSYVSGQSNRDGVVYLR